MKTSKNHRSPFLSLFMVGLAACFLWVSSPVFGQTGNDSERSMGQSKMEAPYKGAQKRLKKRAGFRKMSRFQQLPDLSQAQKDQIKSLSIKYGKLALPIRNQVGEKMARLRTLSTEEKASLKKIYRVIDEIGALKIEMMKNQETLKQKVRALLTDEQKLMMDSRPMQHHPKQRRPGKRFEM